MFFNLGIILLIEIIISPYKKTQLLFRHTSVFFWDLARINK